MFTTARLPGATCEQLRSLTLANTGIEVAEIVPAGTFRPPDQGGRPSPPSKNVPEFCRIAGEIRPSPDSHIRFEVWMPARNWNGKFKGQGNGGFAGSIGYGGIGAAVAQGYASGGTDTGHSGHATDASWALGHPEKVADFGYRGVHEMTEKAKAITAAFYGTAPRRSYFDSCSDGGREALMEAQRFPGDYDGILAGAPANNWTRLLTAGMDVAKTMANTPGGKLPASKLPAISAAILAACDADDGVKDGILNDPRRCRFQASDLLCKGVELNSCLTAPEAKSLGKIYRGGVDGRGHQIFPGLLPGSELGQGGWETWITGSGQGQGEIFAYVNGYFRYMVYDDPNWDLRHADVDQALNNALTKTAQALDSTDPDLHAFRSRGGKLLLYHGWNDPAISALNSIDYYSSVRERMGEAKTNQFLKLYLVPGMQHCVGGPGPSHFGQLGLAGPHDAQHNIFTALEQWVENGKEPGAIVAQKHQDDQPAKPVSMTRPICVYPSVPKFRGTGDSKIAENFSCIETK